MNLKKLETKNSFLPIWLLVAWHEEDADCTLPDRGATAHLTRQHGGHCALHRLATGIIPCECMWQSDAQKKRPVTNWHKLKTADHETQKDKTAEGQNSRRTKRQMDKTAEAQNSRRTKQQKDKTAEGQNGRWTKRQKHKTAEGQNSRWTKQQMDKTAEGQVAWAQMAESRNGIGHKTAKGTKRKKAQNGTISQRQKLRTAHVILIFRNL